MYAMTCLMWKTIVNIQKRERPIAAGTISKSTALSISISLALMSLVLAGVSHPNVLIILSLYLLINLMYSLGIKTISIIDVISVASGFVLRLLAGGFAAGLSISHWIIVMTFLLALFLALAKRRDDVLLSTALGIDVRIASTRYNLDFLNASLITCASVTTVCYLMWCITPSVESRLGSSYIYPSAIFVLAGIMRYFQLIFVEQKTGNPTEILLSDRSIQLTVVLWLSYLFAIMYI